MKRLIFLSLALVSMLTFVACTSDKKQAEQVTMDFFTALNENDYEKARTYTASKQAEAYVNLMSYFESDSMKIASQRPHRSTEITRTEELQDTIICYVATIEQPTEPEEGVDTLNQKVILTKVEDEWKIIELPMK